MAEMDNGYSVLMSVYRRERPEYLRAALDSMLRQTEPPREIILVWDGPLTDGLERVSGEFGEKIRPVKLKKNVGLGRALACGLKYCSCGLVARMDSDDISAPDRCERQLRYFREHPECDVLSGAVAEFGGDALTPEAAAGNVRAYKTLPEENREIRTYIRSRNPVNHPCVMFRRDKVRKAGGYRSCEFFEDYDLWVRMCLAGCVFHNLQDTLLYMRVNGLHSRRGGFRYARAIVRFWTRTYRRGLITGHEWLIAVVSRVAVSLLPNGLRRRKAMMCPRAVSAARLIITSVPDPKSAAFPVLRRLRGPVR